MNSVIRNKKIGIGTVQFGLQYGIKNVYGQTSKEEVKKILKIASEKGITIIDTAHAYGISESVLGEQNLSQFDIVSKFTANTSDSLNEQLHDSLKRLNKTSIYAYLSHSVENLIKNPCLIHTLNKLKEKSIVTKIGCSFNHSREIEMIQRIGFKPDLIQIPFNIFDNRFKEYAIQAKEWNCEVHSRSSFLQGLFFCNTQQLHPFFTPLIKDIDKLQMFGDNLVNMLLSYCANQPFIDVVIIGVDNSIQFEQNINVLCTPIVYDFINFQFDEPLITPSEWVK